MPGSSRSTTTPMSVCSCATSSVRGSVQSRLIQARVDIGVTATADSALATTVCHPSSTVCRMAVNCMKSRSTCGQHGKHVSSRAARHPYHAHRCLTSNSSPASMPSCHCDELRSRRNNGTLRSARTLLGCSCPGGFTSSAAAGTPLPAAHSLPLWFGGAGQPVCAAAFCCSSCASRCWLKVLMLPAGRLAALPATAPCAEPVALCCSSCASCCRVKTVCCPGACAGAADDETARPPLAATSLRRLRISTNTMKTKMLQSWEDTE